MRGSSVRCCTVPPLPRPATLTYTALTHDLARSLHLPFEDTAPEVRETRPLAPLVPLAHDGVGRKQDWKERINE